MFPDFFNRTLFGYGTFQITFSYLLKVLLIIGLAIGFLKLLQIVLKKQTERGKIDTGQNYAILQILKYIVSIISILIILEISGVKITILLAGSAALLVGIGFGIQQVFNDLVSGIILLVEGSVQVRDIVETEKRIGKVLKIGLRTSTLLTREDIIIIVPNSLLVSKEVINWSHNKQPTRFSVAVSIAYGTDVDLVETILLEAAIQHPQVDQMPKPSVRLVDFGESALKYELLFYSYHMFGIEKIRSELRIFICKMLQEKGIRIPYPQTDIHVITNDKMRKDSPTGK